MLIKHVLGNLSFFITRTLSTIFKAPQRMFFPSDLDKKKLQKRRRLIITIEHDQLVAGCQISISLLAEKKGGSFIV